MTLCKQINKNKDLYHWDAPSCYNIKNAYFACSTSRVCVCCLRLLMVGNANSFSSFSWLLLVEQIQQSPDWYWWPISLRSSVSACSWNLFVLYHSNPFLTVCLDNQVSLSHPSSPCPIFSIFLTIIKVRGSLVAMLSPCMFPLHLLWSCHVVILGCSLHLRPMLSHVGQLWKWLCLAIVCGCLNGTK